LGSVVAVVVVLFVAVVAGPNLLVGLFVAVEGEGAAEVATVAPAGVLVVGVVSEKVPARTPTCAVGLWLETQVDRYLLHCRYWWWP